MMYLLPVPAYLIQAVATKSNDQKCERLNTHEIIFIPKPFRITELIKIKNYMSGNFSLALESPGTVARFALNIARYGLPLDYYANYLKYISEVSPEDVQAAAQKYLKPVNSHILIVGKADEIAGNLASFSSTGTINFYDVEGNRIDPMYRVTDFPEGTTAENIIEDYLSAIGGRSRLENLTDISVQMTLEVQGMALESELFRKAPDKFLMNMSMGGNIIQSTIDNYYRIVNWFLMRFRIR